MQKIFWRLLRRDQSKVGEEIVDVVARLHASPKKIQLGILLREMPRQRRRHLHAALVRLLRDGSLCRVIEDDAQLSLVLSRELADLERSRFRGSLPVDIASGIFRQIFADAV